MFPKGTLIKCGIDWTVFTTLSFSFGGFASTVGMALLTGIAGAIGVALVNLVFVPLIKYIYKRFKNRGSKESK